MKTERFFMWKEYGTTDGEVKPRLLTPWADRALYEFPMDLTFSTELEALQAKENFGGEDETWVLVEVSIVPLDVYGPDAKNPLYK